MISRSATGLIRPRDLENAKHYLSIAAKAGLREASLTLARIYHGDYGGTPDLPQAITYYRAALAAGPADIDLKADSAPALSTEPAPVDGSQTRSEQASVSWLRRIWSALGSTFTALATAVHQLVRVIV